MLVAEGVAHVDVFLHAGEEPTFEEREEIFYFGLIESTFLL